MSEDKENRSGIKLERLELALRASNEGIWDWSPGQIEIFYSRRILEFLECIKEVAPNIFLYPHDRIHEEERDKFATAVAEVLHSHGPETLIVDARVHTGSGDLRWLRIRGTVVRDESGKAIRIAGSMIDISRRKAAESQVEDERYLLRQLIDHVPLQIYFKDLESRFVMVNSAQAEWMGHSQVSEIIGKHDRDFFDEIHWKPAEMDEMQIINTGISIIGKIEHETWHLGTDTWVLTSKFSWRDRHGVIKGTFGVSSDVTTLVTTQMAATDLAKQLQHKNEIYEEELHLAREIQQALASEGFPEVCSKTGRDRLDFGARYIPISGLAGDFFEVIKVDENCAAVLICDVMGHGVRSALIVAMLRGLLEKQRPQVNEPGLFLQGLNDGLAAILERAGTTMFATAFIGVVDFVTQTFKYSCAGHPGPIISGPGGIRQLATERREKGPGLGLLRGALYPTMEIALNKVERMILFTDGVIEAENGDGEPFFENRLIELIEQNSDKPINDMLDEILSNVLKFSRSEHFDDDVCLLAFNINRG
jgi:sigma-B regulation protein RsbU (phosphoserine phosphatase)